MAHVSAACLTHSTHWLAYTPPYAWQPLRAFYEAHPVPDQEWLSDTTLGRTFTLADARGHFTVTHVPGRHGFELTLALDAPSHQDAVIARIRHMLDLDIDPGQIESHLHRAFPHLELVEGLRIPRVWSIFEGGVRAILGQQISVGAASKLVNTLVNTLGDAIDTPHGTAYLFPAPERVAASDLQFLKMTGSRRETLHRFAAWHVDAGEQADDIETWQALKGIGPWTVNNAAMRGRGDQDMWIETDLGIKKVILALNDGSPLDATLAAPWRSYLTQQLWSQPAAWAPARKRTKS